MKFPKILFFFILFSVIAFTNLSAQYAEHSNQSGVGLPFFDIVLHNQFAEDINNRLLVTTQILNDDLTFIKSDSTGYDADYELLLAVYNKENNVVLSRTINKKLNVKDFKLTNSRDEKILLKTFMTLKPGAYKLFAKLTDLISGKSTQRKIDIKLPDFTKNSIDISGILFLQDVKLDSASKLVDFIPTIGNNFTTRLGHFYIYFDLYVKDTSQSVSINYTLESKNKEKELDTTIVKTIDSKITSHLFKIKKTRLMKNSYNLVIEAKAGDYSKKKSQSISFFWSDVPGTVEDIDLALRQMVYIVNHDSLDKYENESLEIKQSFFKRFWKERDPDVTTAVNELKNEYFRRVNYANRKYSAFSQDGWKTDRGRILIKFGFPDDIERHPFELGGKPYIVWRYYSLRKTFLFEDHTGFGDYRLHPAYLDVEFQ
jgi:GWxTD domain-containing protein